jgi:hypothetical protein
MLGDAAYVTVRPYSVNSIFSGLIWIEKFFNLYRIYFSSIHFNSVRFWCNRTDLLLEINSVILTSADRSWEFMDVRCIPQQRYRSRTSKRTSGSFFVC